MSPTDSVDGGRRNGAWHESAAQAIQDTLQDLFALSASALVPLLEAIDLVGRRELWRDDGARSLVSWVVGQCRVSGPTASSLVAVARGLRDLPFLTEAMRRGRFSLDQMRHIVRFATPETDAELVEDCESRSVHELAHMASEANPPDDEQPGDLWDLRTFRRCHHRNGMVSHTITLPPASAELVSQSVDEVALRIPRNPGNDLHDPLERRRADAFVAIYSGALGDGDRPTTTVNVHVDGQVLLGEDARESPTPEDSPRDTPDGPAPLQESPVPAGAAGTPVPATPDPATPGPATPGPATPGPDPGHSRRRRRRFGRCSFASGTQVTRREIDRLLCTSRIRIVPETGDGVPMKVHGATRQIPGAVRRHLEHRDRVCRFPGCDNDFALDVHHIIRVPHDGPTDVHNCCRLCKYHHHFTHKSRWRIEGDAETQLTFYRPGGKPLTRPRSPLPDRVVRRVEDVVDGIRRRHLAALPLDRSRLHRPRGPTGPNP